MKVKQENINDFIHAMFNLLHGMKKGMEDCCMLSGNISEKEMVLISLIGQNGNVRMSDLSALLNAPLSTLTSTVDKLVERKYLSRFHSEEDRRVVLVSLDSKGTDSYTIFIKKKQETAIKVLSEFDGKDQRRLIEFIEKIPRILNEKK